MRIMTWNVWGRFGPWQQREPLISETIAAVRPDVLALQEVWSISGTGQADALAARHGLHATFTRSHMPNDPDEDVELGLAILSRWPIRGAESIRLPTGAGPDTVALLVHLRHPDATLHVMTACLDWEEDHQEHRVRQSQELLEILTSSELDGPLPVILAGDLNAPPVTPEIHVLTSAMTDCWSAARTEHANTFDASNPYVSSHDWHADTRIDYILARSGHLHHALRMETATLAGHSHATHNPPSDHYAVVADLTTST
jgi:endonuclease/exonuclease/phosphatase family metal-dependent hydrolase